MLEASQELAHPPLPQIQVPLKPRPEDGHIEKELDLPEDSKTDRVEKTDPADKKELWCQSIRKNTRDTSAESPLGHSAQGVLNVPLTSLRILPQPSQALLGPMVTTLKASVWRSADDTRENTDLSHVSQPFNKPSSAQSIKRWRKLRHVLMAILRFKTTEVRLLQNEVRGHRGSWLGRRGKCAQRMRFKQARCEYETDQTLGSRTFPLPHCETTAEDLQVRSPRKTQRSSKTPVSIDLGTGNVREAFEVTVDICTSPRTHAACRIGRTPRV